MLSFVAYALASVVYVNGNAVEAPPLMVYETQEQCLAALSAMKVAYRQRGLELRGGCADTSNPIIQEAIRKEEALREEIRRNQ